MIYELRTYTMKAGMAPKAANLSSTLGREIRGDDYGKLEGYWFTEIGPLNQVMHLWSYSDLNERARLRGELAKNERWTGEYIPQIRDILVRQDIRLLNAVIDPVKPAQGGNVYEYRNYRVKPGQAPAWCKLFTGALEHREKYSKIVGLFVTEAGQPNEVSHLWAYSDLNARAEARGAAAQDPGWREFLGQGGALLEEMHSTIMLPSASSPLQ